MLNKNRLTKLFEDSDVNIPVTIFSAPLKNSNAYTYKAAWYQAISDSIGLTLNNRELAYHFQITSIKGNIYTLHCTTKQFMNELRSLFEYKVPMSIRIDLLENYDTSWVILLKSDL